jgi:hypothetical protein
LSLIIQLLLTRTPNNIYFATVDRNPFLAFVRADLKTDSAASRTFRTYRQHITHVYRLLNADPAALRVPLGRTNVLLGHIMALNHHPLLIRHNPQHPAGSTLVITGYNLNHLSLFYVKSHRAILVPSLSQAKLLRWQAI